MGSADRTINVYSLIGASPKLINSLTLAEQPLSFSIHPLSTHLAIGSRDSISIYVLLYNDIILLHK